jgi:HAD superfamily hydrolase (TIGR01459 family)
LPRLIAGLAELADGYDVVLCDIWGVVHNGAVASGAALDALSRFRAKGGKVVLITNSPAPSRIVGAQLDSLGASRDAYDAIISSGDVTVSLLLERSGQSLFFIGAPEDTAIFEEVSAVSGKAPIQAPIETADFVLCAGFIDFWSETPKDYDARLAQIRERDLDFICANPDLVVEVDGSLSYCAGAIAERYARLGGKVIQAGKPFAPIYERALALASAFLGAPVERSRVLAIGDAMRTDIKGAFEQGLDSLFVTSGIHRAELHGAEEGAALDAAALRQFVQTGDFAPTAALAELAW